MTGADVTRVLVASPSVGAANADRIRDAVEGAQVTYRPCNSAQEIATALDDRTEVVLTELLPTSIDHAPALRWIQLLSAGVDLFAADRVWTTSDVTITTASGVHVPAISEYIIGSMLEWSQRLHVAQTFKVTRRWGEERERPLNGRPVVGQTLGLLGYGSIARRTARIAHTLGMRVLAVRRDRERSVTDQYRWPFIEALDAGPDRTDVRTIEGLNDVLCASDYLVNTLPLTPHTQNLLGSHELTLLKPNAVVINVSRGGVIEEDALIDALAARRIRGATLDVFRTEPLPRDSRLFDLPNVVLTPHLSGYIEGYFDIGTDLFITNLKRYLRGESLLNVADRDRGY